MSLGFRVRAGIGVFGSSNRVGRAKVDTLTLNS